MYEIQGKFYDLSSSKLIAESLNELKNNNAFEVHSLHKNNSYNLPFVLDTFNYASYAIQYDLDFMNFVKNNIGEIESIYLEMFAIKHNKCAKKYNKEMNEMLANK